MLGFSSSFAVSHFGHLLSSAMAQHPSVNGKHGEFNALQAIVLEAIL